MIQLKTKTSLFATRSPSGDYFVNKIIGFSAPYMHEETIYYGNGNFFVWHAYAKERGSFYVRRAHWGL